MGFFKKLFKHERKSRLSSNISEFRSPYLKKISVPERALKRKSTQKFFSPPPKFKPSVSKGKKILAAILTMIIAGFGVYAIYFSDYFIIRDFKIQEKDTVITDNTDLNEIMKTTLGKNLATIDEDGLSKAILDKHPEIQDLQIHKIFPSTIKIIYQKFPVAANLINMSGGVQHKLLIDSQGLIIDQNQENPDLPYIHITTDTPLQIKQTFLLDSEKSAERLKYILDAINLFEEKFSMKILYADYLQREIEVHLFTEKQFSVWIDVQKDLIRQLTKLKKALPKLDIYHESLLYIDLRISGNDNEKVIFKRK